MRNGQRIRLSLERLEDRTLLTTTTAIQSGAWDDPATWTAGAPTDAVRAIVPSGLTVSLTGDDHVAREIVIQGVLDVEESPGIIKTLTTDWIHVNSGGVFQIGTEADRYDANDFIITLTGDDPTAVFTIEGAGTLTNNNGFLMVASGGRLQFFGDEKLSYTRLAETVSAGASQIRVESAIERNFDEQINEADGSVDWEVGDQVVVASSTEDYRDEEVRVITAVVPQGDGTVLLSLNTPLQKRHYGEIETYSRGAAKGDFNNDGVVDAADYTVWRDNLGASNENAIAGNGDGGGITDADRLLWAANFGATADADFRTWDIDMRAEVALLSRNVRIQGQASQDTDNAFGDRARFNADLSEGFGAHTMIMGSAGQITIDSVQFDRMGQTARAGRYPIHWHIAGDRTGDILRGASITNSNNRGVTVHGTHNLLIENNVLHDIHGHGFFVEDAVETGNLFRANIALGIHAVGRSEAVGDNAPDLNDPFIVDTHDHVGQNPTRFLSSAAFWVTNPDNDFVGNIAAGSEGTGFWFLFPDSPIGAAASDPQYAGVRPDRVNLGVFDHNSSHSAPIGLNFDRGSDIEGPVGATLKPNFDGDAHIPSAEPQITNYTAYKHTTGIYHRGRIGHFEGSRFADNFTSTFITFTQRLTDTLYVGHSRGNSDTSGPVTGHTFYDGANTHDGTHFAGFSAANASMFRTQNVAIRHTHFVMRDSSYQDDGSADNLQYSNQTGGFSSFELVGSNMPSVIYDEDGTLTGHVGGGPGSTVVPDHPFFYDAGDFRPSGWNARVSNDLYAVFRMRSPSGQNPTFRVTTPDGEQGQDSPGNGQFAGTNTLMKMDAGDYVVDFPAGTASASNGFDILYFAVNGPRTGSTVVRFAGMGNVFSVDNRTFVSNLATLRDSSQTVWTRSGSDLYVNFFSVTSESNRVNFVPGVIGLPTVLWEDTSPPDSSTGSAVTKITDPFGTGRGDIGRWVTNGQPQFHNINPAGPALNVSSFNGWDYTFSFEYYVSSNQPLTDDTFYTNVYGPTNFITIGSNAVLNSWTTVTATGTINTSSGTTVEPLIIVNRKSTTETTPSLYIDNIHFSVIAPAAASAAAATAFYTDDFSSTLDPTASSAATVTPETSLAAAAASAVAPSLAVVEETDGGAVAVGWSNQRRSALALLAVDLALADWKDEDPHLDGPGFNGSDSAEQDESPGVLFDELLFPL
ncbi:G8 domain-containing protein [Botrimarina hoheduenensis]|uniref:G8 domain protein n=1 Tax=Botrimarina hoheduenensis TaxID=2528000 RepID=A0A5C5VY95_9BACT|nr:G8 domain-containing protein [Botrimarina hoheduenensis]TWT43117.1 G8 domain protein [Botrimarina hoheduenensis]